MAQHTINTEIIINASIDTVWSILSSFEKYPKWNPFLTSINGDIKEGNIISVTAGGMSFKPRILKYTKNKEIRWIGKFLVKGLFDGEHSLSLIDSLDTTVTFLHVERFSGLLVPLFKNNLNTNVKSGFEEMNIKLKELSEKVDKIK